MNLSPPPIIGLEDPLRVLLLLDYNTRIVVIGAMLLGIVGGIVGAFLMFRQRALVGDVLGHAMLPGVAVAFLGGQVIGGGRNLASLLAGGAVAAMLAGLLMLWLRRGSRLGDDAVMAIVLSGFFGLGVVLLSVVQTTGGSGQAGLEDFIFGKTASMVFDDVIVIALGGGFVLVTTLLIFKELGLLCFDEAFAASIGRPVRGLDLMLLVMTVTTALIGMQAVGLILVVAIMVIPSAAARFLTDDLRVMVVISGIMGAVGCWIGVTASAASPGLPGGAMIVLATSVLFVLAMLFGRQRGLVPRWIASRSLRRQVGRDHLLRSFREYAEVTGDPAIDIRTIQRFRSWGPRRIDGLLRTARRDGEMVEVEPGIWRLSDLGTLEAAAIVRNHRLWEHYLLRYADIAPTHVDRAADRIEHVLDPLLVRSLEAEVGDGIAARSPVSPHPLGDDLPDNARYEWGGSDA